MQHTAQRHRDYARRHACLGLALALASGSGQACADWFEGTHYDLGRGLQVPALDFTLSGYTSLVARNLAGEDASLDLRDLSLFAIWQPTPRWQVFSEFEVEHLLVIDDRGATGSDIEVAVERLYVDYAMTPAATVRAGRYLTPFGRWNQVHADPLVWTVSRPLVTQLAIPDHGSGAALLGSLALGANTLDWTVFVDDSDHFDPKYGDADFEDFEALSAPGLTNNFHRAAGGQLRYHFLGDRAEIATSYAALELADMPGTLHAIGVDGLLRWRRLEFSGEAAWRDNDQLGAGDDWGAFAQAVVRLAGDVYGITRGEYYQSGIVERGARRMTLGLGWRPLPPLNVKLEYSDGNDRQLTPDGVQVSFSMLF